VFVLYAAYRYGWGATTVGLTLTFVGICSAVVQGLLVGPIVGRIRPRCVLFAGLVMGGLGMAIYGLAPSGTWFLAGAPIMALRGISGPAAMNMMSRRVSAYEQGQLQGANSSVRSLAGLCSVRGCSPARSPGCSAGCPARRSCWPRRCWLPPAS
jgi:DHA1 family tetracycline resistance protein-like MFS transporter